MGLSRSHLPVFDALYKHDGMAQLLLIEDDAELADLTREWLEREGFSLTLAHDGEEGLQRATAPEAPLDLVLLDLMLPKVPGVEVLRELRRRTPLPVIVLTAKGEDVDKVVGLELGADDYVTKPFNPRELVARIRAVLRRSKGTTPATGPSLAATAVSGVALDPLRVGPIVIDADRHRVWLSEKELQLTAVEFALLLVLVEAKGKVLSRDNLLDRLRGREFDTFDRSIDVHISHLRSKLGDDAKAPRFIKTIRGAGYAFADSVA